MKSQPRCCSKPEHLVQHGAVQLVDDEEFAAVEQESGDGCESVVSGQSGESVKFAGGRLALPGEFDGCCDLLFNGGSGLQCAVGEVFGVVQDKAVIEQCECLQG